MQKIIVAICGASGVIYGIRLLKALLQKPIQVHLIISEAGRLVLEHEMSYNGKSFELFLKENNIRFHENASLMTYEKDDFFAPFASGSFRHNGMVIAPCSRGSTNRANAIVAPHRTSTLVVI